MSLPYNRALHTDDYADPLLAEYRGLLQAFEQDTIRGRMFYRKDHEHREWEYSNVLLQLAQLQAREKLPMLPSNVKVLDTGFGINYFTLMLHMIGFDVTANDSEDYGKVTEVFRQQCDALGIQVPLNISPVQKLTLPDNEFDVTLCISVIEHLAPEQFADGLRELVRVTKPGGFLMITSDFFRDEAHADQSPNVHCQLSRFYEANAITKIDSVIGDRVDWVGGVDNEAPFTGVRYRGDFVNGHGFVNFCLQKRA